ncbi:MAG TPA: cytochrome c biogenesis protein DipZ, partial [Burkholderiaceae bacterium]|nr:cytochrome c biogenesis protein DipZ [Burkholderiaceae bacterium]
YVQLDQPGGSVALRFQARDAHLVLGTVPGRGPVRFRLTLDGQPPGADHGEDVDAEGRGTLDAQRLYQLVRQKGAVDERTVEIQFLDAGARAYAFTFG